MLVITGGLERFKDRERKRLCEGKNLTIKKKPPPGIVLKGFTKRVNNSHKVSIVVLITRLAVRDLKLRLATTKMPLVNRLVQVELNLKTIVVKDESRVTAVTVTEERAVMLKQRTRRKRRRRARAAVESLTFKMVSNSFCKEWKNRRL